MEPYADYFYYQETYRGTMPEADFNRLSRQASYYIDSLTFGRIQGDWLDSSRVKDACCAVAEQMRRQEQGGEVASATNDGYSETYITSGKTPAQRQYATVAQYLGMTGLMYRGGNA